MQNDVSEYEIRESTLRTDAFKMTLVLRIDLKLKLYVNLLS
jgi:hypothetical protein